MSGAVDRLTAALADRYRIERELGHGGMATVYLAQDVKHDRQVAVKVLRPELAAMIGAERFLAEIRTTANLQHPHILPLFDSGVADDSLFYVMPFIEGETVRDRLNREKQLPVSDAVRIATQVAAALDYAHRRNVIHRDIKPENILLHDGSALIADFGIALAASKAGGARMTETGLSLGTPHYMSPEQAMGEREITAKSDVFALGCVLYEMLVGEPPFMGPTAHAIIARVMTEEPRSLTSQRHTIPPHVEAAVRTALEKLPADRFASAAQFADALGKSDYATSQTGAGRAAAPAVTPPTARQRVGRGVPWVLAAAGIGMSVLLVTNRARSVPAPTVRFTLSFGRGAALEEGLGSPLAFSPDGSRLAYQGRDSAGTQRLFLRDLHQVEPVPVPGTINASVPFFSPDGRWLAFAQDGKLRKVALAGGAAVTICDATELQYGASWGVGDVIVYSARGRLMRVSAVGGQPTVIAAPDSTRAEAFRFPELLPDGKAVVFAAFSDSGPSLRVVTLAENVVTPLGQRGMSPHYVDGGYLAYTEVDGTLFAAPFDAARRRLTGPPEPITTNVKLIADIAILGTAQAAKVAVARTGTLAYLAGSGGRAALVVYDREGRASTLPLPPNEYHSPRFSPDGGRIAVTVVALSRRASAGLLGDTWVWRNAERSLQRITFDTLTLSAQWSPDGRALIYAHGTDTGSAISTIASDGSGKPEALLTRGHTVFELSLTPDGRQAAFRETVGRPTGQDIWIAPLAGAGVARPLLVRPFADRNPAGPPMVGGWHTPRTRPARWRSMCAVLPKGAGAPASPLMAVPSRGGRAAGANCSTGRRIPSIRCR